MEGVVLHREGILGIFFCPKQGHGFKNSAAPLQYTQTWVKYLPGGLSYHIIITSGDWIGHVLRQM